MLHNFNFDWRRKIQKKSKFLWNSLFVAALGRWAYNLSGFNQYGESLASLHHVKNFKSSSYHILFQASTVTIACTRIPTWKRQFDDFQPTSTISELSVWHVHCISQWPRPSFPKSNGLNTRRTPNTWNHTWKRSSGSVRNAKHGTRSKKSVVRARCSMFRDEER